MHLTDEVGQASGGQGGSGVLMLHLLGRCNLRCDHCYMEGAPERREALAPDDVIAAVSQAGRLGFGTIYLTGGEPLLYPALDAVLQAAVQPGVTTTLCTNATRLKPGHIQRLAELNIRLNISLDGPPAFHDAFRHRRLAHDGAVRGIGAAAGAGLHVTVITTATRANLHHVPWLFDRALELGAKAYRVQPLLDLGRGQAIQSLALDGPRLDWLVMTLSDLANTHRGAMEVSVIGQSKRYLLAHPCAAYVCNGGGCHRKVQRELKKLVVREDGTMLPESTNLNPAFAIGQLGAGALAEQITCWINDETGRGYPAFDRLARSTYADLVPDWPLTIVPWDALLAARSQRPVMELPASSGCGALRGAKIFLQPRPGPGLGNAAGQAAAVG